MIFQRLFISNKRLSPWRIFTQTTQSSCTLYRISKSLGKDQVPGIFFRVFLTLPAHPSQCITTLNSTTCKRRNLANQLQSTCWLRRGHKELLGVLLVRSLDLHRLRMIQQIEHHMDKSCNGKRNEYLNWNIENLCFETDIAE